MAELTVSGRQELGDKPAAAEGSIMTNQQEAPKSTVLDGKIELFYVLGRPLLVRAVDFNRLYDATRLGRRSAR